MCTDSIDNCDCYTSSPGENIANSIMSFDPADYDVDPQSAAIYEFEAEDYEDDDWAESPSTYYTAAEYTESSSEYEYMSDDDIYNTPSSPTTYVPSWSAYCNNPSSPSFSDEYEATFFSNEVDEDGTLEIRTWMKKCLGRASKITSKKMKCRRGKQGSIKKHYSELYAAFVGLKLNGLLSASPGPTGRLQ